MSISDRVKKWRKETKRRLCEGFGSKCNRCGYSKCLDALDFHHVDSSTKSFGLGGARGSIRGWAYLVEEVEKCVLLCSNCHRELHAGLWRIDEIVRVQFFDYYNWEKELKGKKIRTKTNEKKQYVCSICKLPCSYRRKYCNSCCDVVLRASRPLSRKVEWPTRDELAELIWNVPTVHIAKKYNVSDSAVAKWCKKYMLAKPPRGYWSNKN